MGSISKRSLGLSFLVASSAFCSLAGYEFVRSCTNTLFMEAYGTQALPWAMAMTPFALVGCLWFYNRMLSKMGPKKTLACTILGSGLFAILCYVGITLKVTAFALVLFLFRECYVVLIIEQYWSFLNSKLKEDEAKVLNGPIAGWSSIGAIIGGMSVGYLAVPMGTESMLLFAAILSLPAVGFAYIAYTIYGEPRSEKPKKSAGIGLSVLFKEHLLVTIFLLVLVTQLVASVLDMSFQTALYERFTHKDEQTAYSGYFFALLNMVSATLQFLVAPLLLRWFRASHVQVFIPAVHVMTLFIMWQSPSMFTISLAFLIFKAFDYSIFRATKEIFYIPMSFDARFRAKEVIDVFGYRFGKGITSAALAAVSRVATISQNVYALVALLGSLGWIMVALRINRELEPHPCPTEAETNRL